MRAPLFIYVHGFNSSPASIKAQLFGRYLSEHQVHANYEVPALSHWPAQAMGQLCALVEANTDRQIILIGSSLGGYYSTWLTEHYDHVRAVLVNPSIRPFVLLERWLGDNENLYTHDHYELTPEHLAQLQAINCNSLVDPGRYLLLVQTADETLDYQEAVDKFSESTQFVQPGGSHGFDRFQDLIPAILAFGAGQIKLPPASPLP
ncbi:MAG: YqiA/YcfP family alpha/beta fold hydrolase [Pontibacterium sp.]